MLYAHPKVDNETVRVRFAGFGASSLDVNIRIYLLTREWNEYYAVQEDVFFALVKSSSKLEQASRSHRGQFTSVVTRIG